MAPSLSPGERHARSPSFAYAAPGRPPPEPVHVPSDPDAPPGPHRRRRRMTTRQGRVSHSTFPPSPATPARKDPPHGSGFGAATVPRAEVARGEAAAKG